MLNEKDARAVYAAEIKEYGWETVRSLLRECARIIGERLRAGKTPLQAAGAAIRRLTEQDSGFPPELVHSLFIRRGGNLSVLRAGDAAEEIYEHKNS